MMARKRRRWLWITGGIGLALVCVYGYFRLTYHPVNKAEARALATDLFQRFMDEDGIDPHIFDGPAPATAKNARYGFQWTYSDEKGKIIIYVWVQASGWTDFAVDGEIERLRKAKKDRAQ